MVKKLLFLAVFSMSINSLSAEEGQPVEKGSQIGKYQLVAGHVGGFHPDLYLLDTETGVVWYMSSWSDDQGHRFWIQYTAPVQN